MSEPPLYVRLTGTLYTGKLRFVGPRYLDFVSTMILRAVAREPSLARLRGVFGLPERLVNDIIGDLIRRSLVLLDVDAGTCELPESTRKRVESYDALPPGALFESGADHKIEGHGELWQDRLTGRLLAWKTLMGVNRRPPDNPRYVDLLPHADTRLPDLLNAPDGQIVAVLGPVFGWHSQSRGPEWRLDGFVERSAMREAQIWLPVRLATVDQREHRFIDAPEGIPPEVVERWTRALGRSSSAEPPARPSDESSPVQYTPVRDASREARTFLGQIRPDRQCARWMDQVRAILNAEKLPNATDLSELEARSAAFVEACRRFGHVEFLKGPEAHAERLRSLIQDARRYVMLGSTQVSSGGVQNLRPVLTQAARRDVDVFLLRGSRKHDDAHMAAAIVEELEKIPSGHRYVHLVPHMPHVSFEAEFAIADGVEALVTSWPLLDLAGQKHRVLGARIVNPHALADLVGFAQEVAGSSSQEGRLFRQLSAFSRGEPKELRGVVALRDVVLRGIDAIRTRLCAYGGEETTGDVREGAPIGGPMWREARASCRKILEEVDAGFERLSREPPFAPAYVLDNIAHHSALLDAFSPRGGAAALITERLQPSALEDDIVDVIARATRRGCSVQLFWKPTPAHAAESAETAARLVESVDRDGFSVAPSSGELGGEAFAVHDVACVTSYGLLGNPLEPKGSKQVGVVLLSEWAAQDLHAAITRETPAP